MRFFFAIFAQKNTETVPIPPQMPYAYSDPSDLQQRRKAMCGAKATQSGGGVPRPVLVLTERWPDYESVLGFPWLEPLYESSVAGLLERLADQPVSGFVLELDKVLHATGMEREHLFQLSEAFPLLRVRRSEQGGLACLDDLERFALLVRGLSPRLARHVPRVPVLLGAVLRRHERGPQDRAPDAATEEDAVGLPATFLDISACGGALCCEAELGPGEEIDVRILELSDAAPLTSLVCWSGWRGRNATRRCVGVRFLGMSPNQAKELGERYLGSRPAA